VRKLNRAASMNLYSYLFLPASKQIFSNSRDGSFHRPEKDTTGADVVRNGDISGDSHMRAAISARNVGQLGEVSSREKATTKMFLRR